MNGAALYTQVNGESADALVERYVPLVKKIAHHLMARMPTSIQVDDLIQAGIIGLLEAGRKYDASKGASFETYAGIRIRGAMIDDVRRGDWAPRSVHRNQRRVSDAMKTVENRLGRDASDSEVADELGVELDEYYDMLHDSVSCKLFSLDELNSIDDHTEERMPSSDMNPLDCVQSGSLRESLATEISHLPERERLVLSLYYGEEMNLKEIGLVLGVSESRVSQIHTQAAARLRTRMTGWSSQPAN